MSFGVSQFTYTELQVSHIEALLILNRNSISKVFGIVLYDGTFPNAEGSSVPILELIEKIKIASESNLEVSAWETICSEHRKEFDKVTPL